MQGGGGLSSCIEDKPEYKILTVRPVIQNTDVKIKSSLGDILARKLRILNSFQEFLKKFTKTSWHLRNLI